MSAQLPLFAPPTPSSPPPATTDRRSAAIAAQASRRAAGYRHCPVWRCSDCGRAAHTIESADYQAAHGCYRCGGAGEWWVVGPEWRP